MRKTNMNFVVDGDAVACNMIDGEVKARMAARRNPEKKEFYRQRGIIDSSPAITRFMLKYPSVFGNSKLIHQDGTNFFGGILSLSSLSGTTSHKKMLENRMRFEYNLSDEEIDGMQEFFEDLTHLKDTPELKEIVSDTVGYKNSIKQLWQAHEGSIMKHVKNVLGYEPEVLGSVNAYIMYPNFNTHRSCQLSDKKTSMYFGMHKNVEKGKKDSTYEQRVLSYLTHQAVHQPMLPYKASMTKKEKETFHGFIKYLTDKDVYFELSGRSYLDILTQNENHELMAKMYPFWLGYRYRNADKEGKNSVIEIKKAITRDKEYYDKLPEGKRKQAFSGYRFETLDANKIAQYFKGKRGMTPYEFAKIDFDDRSLVCKSAYLSQEER